MENDRSKFKKSGKIFVVDFNNNLLKKNSSVTSNQFNYCWLTINNFAFLYVILLLTF